MLFTPAETKVVIVGGGTMGADVAAVCARGGCAVQVVEPTTERRALLPDYFINTMTELGYENRIHLLTVAGSLEEVDWSEIDLVIECSNTEDAARVASEIEKITWSLNRLMN